MKLIIFLLIVTFCYSSPILGGYQPISIEEAQSNSRIKSFIQEGLQAITKDGMDTGEITTSDFVLSQINSVSLQILDEQNYKFNCDFQDSQGTTIQADFEVTYNAFSKESSVTSHTYKVVTESVSETVQQSYVMIETSEIEHSTEIQKVINFGVEQVSKQATWEGKTSGSTYQVSNIISVERQVSGSAIFYKCDVEFFAEQRFIEAKFTVYYQPQQDVCALIDYSLPNEAIENVVNTESVITEEILASVEDQFVQVDTEQVEQNQIVFDCLNYGVQEIKQIGIEKGQLSETELNIVSISKIETQIAGNGVFYKYDCELSSQQSQTITASFTVYYVITTTQQSLASYSVQVQTSEGTTSYSSNNNPEIETEFPVVGEAEVSISDQEDTGNAVGIIPEGDIEDGADDEQIIIIIEEQVSEEESVDDTAVDWVDYESINSALEDQYEAESETEVFEESPANDSETIIIEETFPINEEKPEESIPTEVIYTSNYAQVPQGEIESNQEIQGVLDYGTKKVYEIGVEQGKVKESNFIITSVESVYKKVTEKSASFKCQVTMNDDKGWTLRMNFTVSHTYSTGKYFMSSYKYVISKGISSPPPNNNNGQTPTTDYVEVSQDEIANDQAIQDMLNYATNLIYNLGVEQGKIKQTNFQITSVESLYKKITQNGVSYQCQLTMNNDDGWTLKMNFTISYSSSKGTYFMSKYRYVIGNKLSDSKNEQYVQVSQEEIESSQEIQDVLDYGTTDVYKKGVQQGKIPGSNFVITNVESVSKMIISSGVTYKCQVTLNDNDGWTLKMNFTISKYSSGNYFMWYYKYHVSKGYPTSSNTNTGNGQTSDSYQELDMNQIKQNQEIQAGIIFGVNVVIQKGVEQTKIPSSQYQITKVISVSQQVQSSGTYYKCNTELQNAGGILIKMSFTVYYKVTTQVWSLSKYSYHVSNIPVKSSSSVTTQGENSKYTSVQQSEYESSTEIQSSLNYVVEQVIQNYEEYTTKKINNCYRRVVNSAFYYKLDVTLSTETGKTTNLNCIVKDQVNIGVKSVVAYSYKVSYQSTTTITTSSSSSGYYPGPSSSFSSTSTSSQSYSQVEISTVKDDSTYKSILKSGVEQCVKNLVSRNIVAGSRFQVSQVKSVFRQETTIEENYQFQVQVSNLGGISLDLNFGVRYDKTTSQTTLISYSVQGSASTQTTSLVADYTNNDGGQIDVSTCEPVPSKQESETEIQEMIQFGVSEVGKIVVQQNSEISSESSFQVSKIEGVYQDVVNVNTYRVVATITNSVGVNVYCSFSVKYEAESKQLNSCSYFIY